MMHIELILGKDIRSVSRFFFFFFFWHLDIQLFQHNLLKKNICSIVLPVPFVRGQLTIYVGLFL